MKIVKVFIASSEELRLERLEFTDMIQQLNRILKPRGVEIDPVKWEYLDASMGPLHKQEEYNRELKTCEICLVLYWNRFGDYTKSELDTAYSELCAGRNPQKLYVYFKDANDITPELKAFKESFSTKYGHFFCRFENVDTMKLNFLLQFEDYQNKSSEALLKVRESRVEIDGQPFVELKNVPFAGNNPEYLQLLKQIESTQARVLKYPDDREFRQELHDLQEQRKAMESSLLDTAKLITRLSSTTTSARLAEAMRLFEMGDNKGANAILNLDEISHDAEANAARIDAAREIEAESVKALESNIEEYRLKIKTLQNAMEKGWVNEVIVAYDKAVSMARNRIAPEKFVRLLRNYADFLRENKQYHLVRALYDEALSIYRELAIQNPEAFNSDVAMTLNNLAALHYQTKRFDKAEQEYNEALAIYRGLAMQNPEAYDSDVATTLNNLATLHSDTQRFDKAEQEYDEAMEILRRLAENNPEAFDSDVATTLNNLANLHSKTQRFDMAEQECGEALKIRRRLAEKKTEAFDSDLAMTLHNLAYLHSKAQHFDKAELEYNEALEIYRRLAENSPEAFESDVAWTLNNLANLHSDVQRFDKAELEYNEALEISRRLAEKNPEASDSDVAMTLNNLANLHSDIQRFDKAEQELCEALEIYRRLAENSPEAFESDVAWTLNNLACLHKKTQRFDKAEQEYGEALEIYHRLAENSPEAFDSDVARTLHNLANLHSKTQRFDMAIEELKEALTIYRRMAEYTYVDEERVRAIESYINDLQNS